jgi:hypothetical protein
MIAYNNLVCLLEIKKTTLYKYLSSNIYAVETDNR